MRAGPYHAGRLMWHEQPSYAPRRPSTAVTNRRRQRSDGIRRRFGWFRRKTSSTSCHPSGDVREGRAPPRRHEHGGQCVGVRPHVVIAKSALIEKTACRTVGNGCARMRKGLGSQGPTLADPDQRKKRRRDRSCRGETPPRPASRNANRQVTYESYDACRVAPRQRPAHSIRTSRPICNKAASARLGMRRG